MNFVKNVTKWLIVSSFLMVFSVVAARIEATPEDEPVVAGEWHQSLDKVLEAADSTGTPVLGFWSNEGCSICTRVVNNIINTPAFTAWRQERQILLVTGEGESGQAGKLYDWTKAAATGDGSTKYPFLRIYWKDRDGSVKADYRFSGSTVQTVAATTNKIERYIGDFEPGSQVSFPFDVELELEPDTPVLLLPLERAFSSGTLVSELFFEQTQAEGDPITWSEIVEWQDGESFKEVEIAFSNHYPGGYINITLVTEGDQDQEARVNFVEKQPITTHNPQFIGDEFNFAEWTMDIDAATNAVANAEGDAFTIVLFTATHWCPYCMGLEEGVLNTPEFKAFAEANQIALVEIDNHTRADDPPSLLCHGSFYSSNVLDSRNGNSGADYLSRRAIPASVGADVQERNLALQREWTLPGAVRIGYPTMVLLRKDGSIAGRFSGYNSETIPTEYIPIFIYDLERNMLRMAEFIEMAKNPQELGGERNNYIETTTDVLHVKDSFDATLHALNTCDIYKLETSAGIKQRVVVSGSESAVVQVTLLDSEYNEIASVNGNLSDGIVLEQELTEEIDIYLKIVTADDLFALSSANSTKRDYNVTTDFSLMPLEKMQTLALAPLAEENTLVVDMTVTQDEIYYIATSGAGIDFDPAAMEPLGNSLYRAKVSDSAAFTISGINAVATLTWCLWKPGEVGFTVAAQSVAETAGEAAVTLSRIGGSSGVCHIMVLFNEDESTATPDEDFVDIFGAGYEVIWEDGESGVKEIVIPIMDDLFYEGNEDIVLDIVITEGHATGIDDKLNLVLTIVDNDKPVVGQLAITGADQMITKDKPVTLIMEEGSAVTLEVSRILGASKPVSTEIQTSGGSVEPAVLEWGNNDPQPVKQVAWQLPMLDEVASSKVTATLYPSSDIRAASRQKQAVVQLYAVDAPIFAENSIKVNAVTGVAVERRVSLERLQGGKLRLKKISGRIPTGIRVRVDEDSSEMVISGVTSRAGAYSIVYQVAEQRDRRYQDGGVIEVNFEVTTLADLNPAASTTLKYAGGMKAVDDIAVIVGVLEASISNRGRITAKYRSATETISFRAASWDDYDLEGMVSADIESTRGGYRLKMQLAANGAIAAQIIDPDPELPLLEAIIAPARWSAEMQTGAFEGYYTAVLAPDISMGVASPVGFSYLTISVRAAAARTGRVNYAGLMADGTSVSGSATLQQLDDGDAHFVLFTKKGTHRIAALLRIAADARNTYLEYPSSISSCGDVTAYWQNESKDEETAFITTLDICGGFYNTTADIAALADEYEGNTPMILTLHEPFPLSDFYGVPVEIPEVTLDITSTAMRITRQQENPTKARISFNRRTGVFKGSFTLEFELDGTSKKVSTKYAGVLLPGWNKEDCGCGDEELDLPLKPFGMGACWFKDQLPSENTRSGWLRYDASYPLVIDKFMVGGGVDQ